LLQINELRHAIRNKGIKEVMRAVLDSWIPTFHARRMLLDVNAVIISI